MVLWNWFSFGVWLLRDICVVTECIWKNGFVSLSISSLKSTSKKCYKNSSIKSKLFYLSIPGSKKTRLQLYMWYNFHRLYFESWIFFFIDCVHVHHPLSHHRWHPKIRKYPSFFPLMTLLSKDKIFPSMDDFDRWKFSDSIGGWSK